MPFHLQALFLINIILSELQKLKIQVLSNQGFLNFLNHMYPKFGGLLYKKVRCDWALRLTSKASPILKSDRGQAVERKHSKLCQSFFFFFKPFISVVTKCWQRQLLLKLVECQLFGIQYELYVHHQ